MEREAIKIQALIRGSLTRKRLKRDPQFSKLYKTSHRSLVGAYDGVSLDDYGQDDLVLFSNRRYQERKKMRDSARTGEEQLDRLVSVQSDEEICRTEGKEKSQVLTDNLASLSASSEEDIKDISADDMALAEGKGESVEKPQGINDPLSLKDSSPDLGDEALGAKGGHLAEADREEDKQEESKELARKEEPEASLQGEAEGRAPVKGLEDGQETEGAAHPVPSVDPGEQTLTEKVSPDERLEAEPSARSIDPSHTEEKPKATLLEPQKSDPVEPEQKREEIPSPHVVEAFDIAETGHKEDIPVTVEKPLPLVLPAAEDSQIDPLKDSHDLPKPESAPVQPQEDLPSQSEVAVGQIDPEEDTSKAAKAELESEHSPAQHDLEGMPEPQNTPNIPKEIEDVPMDLPVLPTDKPIPTSQEQVETIAAASGVEKSEDLPKIETSPKSDATPVVPEPAQWSPVPPEDPSVAEQFVIIDREMSTPEPETHPCIYAPIVRISITTETESDEPEIPRMPETGQTFDIASAEKDLIGDQEPPFPTIAPETLLPQTEAHLQTSLALQEDKPRVVIEQIGEKKEESGVDLPIPSQSLVAGIDNQQLPVLIEPEEKREDLVAEREKPRATEAFVNENERESSEAIGDRREEPAEPKILEPIINLPKESPLPSPKKGEIPIESETVPPIDSGLRPLEEQTAAIPIHPLTIPYTDTPPAANSLDSFSDLPKPQEVIPSLRSQEPLVIPEIRESMVPSDPQLSPTADPSSPERHPLKTDQPTFRVANPANPSNPAGQRPSLKQPLEKRGSETMLSPQTIESIQPSYRTPSFPESVKSSFRDSEGRSQDESPSRPVFPEKPVEAEEPILAEDPIIAEEPQEAPAPELASLSKVSADSSEEEAKIESPKYANFTENMAPEPAVAVSMFDAPKADSSGTLSDNSSISSNSSLSDKEDLDADASLLLPELPRLGASSSAALLRDTASKKDLSKPPRSRPPPRNVASQNGYKSYSQENSMSVSGSEEQLRGKKGVKSSSLLRHPLPMYAKRPSNIPPPKSNPHKKPKVPRTHTSELIPPSLKKKPSPYDFQWSKRMLERVFKVGVEVKIRPAIYLPDMRVRKLRKSVVRVLKRGVDLPEIISRSEKEKQEREFVSRVKDRV